jgi:hypothetical protein
MPAAPRPQGGAGTAKGVSGWWRIAAIAIAIAFVILSAATGAFLAKSSGSTPHTQTKVQWYSFEVPSGPGPDENGTNVTLLPAPRFCVPDNATTVGIFSLNWATSTTTAVESVQLYALHPSTTGQERPYAEWLYNSTNQSSGGTSFLSLFPNPCSYDWALSVESSFAVTVLAVTTLTYNVTVT